MMDFFKKFIVEATASDTFDIDHVDLQLNSIESADRYGDYIINGVAYLIYLGDVIQNYEPVLKVNLTITFEIDSYDDRMDYEFGSTGGTHGQQSFTPIVKSCSANIAMDDENFQLLQLEERTVEQIKVQLQEFITSKQFNTYIQTLFKHSKVSNAIDSYMDNKDD